MDLNLNSGPVSASTTSTMGDGSVKILTLTNMQTQGQLVRHSNEISSTTLISPDGAYVHAWPKVFREVVSAPILTVRCRDTYGELHKSKFGSGSKGKCIKVGMDWYTPIEFENLAGRGNSKDWKRSIRCGGVTLHTLSIQGHLNVHAATCECCVCVDSQVCNAPIRLRVPYKRKRKSAEPEPWNKSERKGSKLLKLSTNEKSNISIGTGDPPVVPTPTVTSVINPILEEVSKINQIKLPSTTQQAWKVVEDAANLLVKSAVSIQTLVHQLKERTTQEENNLRAQQQQQQYLNFVQMNQPHSGSEVVYVLGSFENVELKVGDSEQVNNPFIEVSKCRNCEKSNDGTMMKCSRCMAVFYCSRECQVEHWVLHQVDCTDVHKVEIETGPGQ